MARATPTPGVVDPVAGEAELAAVRGALTTMSGDVVSAVAVHHEVASDAARAVQIGAALAGAVSDRVGRSAPDDGGSMVCLARSEEPDTKRVTN